MASKREAGMAPDLGALYKDPVKRQDWFPLEQRLLLLLGSKFLDTYALVASALDVPGIADKNIASWVSWRRGNLPPDKHPNFALYHERDSAIHTLLDREHGFGENKRAHFIKQLCDALGDEPITTDYFSKKVNKTSPTKNPSVRSYRGKISEISKTLGIHREYISQISAVLRYELIHADKGSLDNDTIQDYMDVVRAVGRFKLEQERLGKDSEGDKKLRTTAVAMAHVRTTQELGYIDIPTSWEGDLFMNSLGIIQKVFTDPSYFTPTEVELLERIARGEKMEQIGQNPDFPLGTGPTKVLKNLLVYGRPNDVQRKSTREVTS